MVLDDYLNGESVVLMMNSINLLE